MFFIHHIIQQCSCVPIDAGKLIKPAGLWFLLAVTEYILFCNIWHLRAVCLHGAWEAGLGSWCVHLLKHIFVLPSKLTGCETVVYSDFLHCLLKLFSVLLIVLCWQPLTYILAKESHWWITLIHTSFVLLAFHIFAMKEITN